MCVAPQKKPVTEQYHSRNIKRTASASSQQLPRRQQIQHIIFNNFSKPQILDRPSLGLVPTENSPQMNIIILIQACIGRTPIFNSMLYKNRKIIM